MAVDNLSEASPGQARRRRLVAITGRLAVAAVFVLIALFAIRDAGSLDIGFHLRAGEHILSGQGWPQNDPFTYTLGDRPYVDTSWGYQVLLTLVQRAGDSAGMVLLHAVFVLAMFGALHATARLAPVDRPLLAAVLLLAAIASELRFEVRPELLSYALLAWVLYLLERHDRGMASPLWLLPAGFLLWSNSHSLYILGWGALGAYVLGGLLRTRTIDTRLARWAAASVAVAFINPYGWRGVAFPFTLATRLSSSNVFKGSIGEFVSPWNLEASTRFPFQPQLPLYCYRLLALAALAAIVVAVRRRRFGAAIVAAAFVYLSFRMVRNVPLAVIGCVPLLAGTFRLPAVDRGASWVRSALAALVIVSALVTGARVINDAHYIAHRRTVRFGVGWNDRALPIAAASYIRRSNLPGRMLNHLNFGGYLMWAQSQPVFVDGRLEVVGEAFYDSYRRAFSDEPSLAAAVSHWGIGWIVYPYRLAPRLTSRLVRDPAWRLLYADDLAAIWARTDRGALPAMDRATRARLEAPAAPVESTLLAGLGGPPRPSPVGHWLRGIVRRERFPWTSFGHGLFELFRGRQGHAAHWFATSIGESDGAYYEMYNNLGLAWLQLGELERAERCYEIVVAAAPDNERARERLATIRIRLGR